MRDKRQMKPNLLFRFGQSGWCRHGLALTYDNGHGLFAADTYWGGSYSDNRVDLTELEASGEFIADLDEFRKSNQYEYYRYAAIDRVWIPIGGSSECYLVRSSANPNPTNAIAQINSEIEHWQAKKHSAEWHIEELRKELSGYFEGPEKEELPATGS
jgi:hypothetical protein